MLLAPEVVIEEYEPLRHAKSIAEMWNRSYESWEATTPTRLNKVSLKSTRTGPI